MLHQDEVGDTHKPKEEQASRSALWHGPSTHSPEPLPLQGALGFISLAPAVAELEHSHAYLGVLAQGTLERAGF